MITIVLFRDHGNQPRSAVVNHGEGFDTREKECRDQVTNLLTNFDYNRGFSFIGPFEDIDASELIVNEKGDAVPPQTFDVL